MVLVIGMEQRWDKRMEIELGFPTELAMANTLVEQLERALDLMLVQMLA